MDEIIKEIKRLNENLSRLISAVSPGLDPSIFGRFHAFRAGTLGGRLTLQGIASPDPVRFRELKGIDDVLARLRLNTEQFLAGLPCNNVLIYGPRGTGKSSALKALLNEYRRKGLRMIEIPREALSHLRDVADSVTKRQERFILFCDDLSFAGDEGAYRSVKSVIEGSLAVRPANVLVCATSNRRHLMSERPEDGLPTVSDGELHPADTMEEKLSLSDRFGLRIGLEHITVETYLDIIRNYVRLRRLRPVPESLDQKALEWAMDHGGYSGRAARQFVDDLEGRAGLRKPHR